GGIDIAKGACGGKLGAHVCGAGIEGHYQSGRPRVTDHRVLSPLEPGRVVTDAPDDHKGMIGLPIQGHVVQGANIHVKKEDERSGGHLPTVPATVLVDQIGEYLNVT